METKVLINEGSTKTNVQVLNDAAKAAKRDIKGVGIMYFVNQLNKFARKNEYIDGVNIANFGLEVKTLHNEKDLFTAKVFTLDSNKRPSYLVENCNENQIAKAKEKGFDIVDENSYRKPVILTLCGLISAYTALLKPAAKDADKIIRDAKKAETKEANKAKAALKREANKARRELTKQLEKGIITPELYVEKLAQL